MEVLRDFLGKDPKEFLKECLKMSELIKKKKIIWSKRISELDDEKFKTLICNGSENFVCLEFQNEKYFLNLTNEKPCIIIYDDIPFPLECPKFNSEICKIKKAVEKKIITFEKEEEEEF